jgi:hypothetical protein
MTWDLFLQLEFLIVTAAVAVGFVKAINPGKAKENAGE